MKTSALQRAMARDNKTEISHKKGRFDDGESITA